MNKQLICDYINYNAPRLHNLGDISRAMIDIRYRTKHLGPDINLEQIISIKSRDNHLDIIVNKGKYGIPKYKIPNPVKPMDSPMFLLCVQSNEVYQKYILKFTNTAFFWDDFAIFKSDRHWMFSKIPNPFRLPLWDRLDGYKFKRNGREYIRDSHIEILDITFDNINCPVIVTEDIDYNIVETPIDNEYIQNLIS